MINQGDVFWLSLRGSGSEPMGRRPVVVVQHDRFNRSAINTTVVAVITSNIRLAALPGNVRLPKGTVGLNKPSVINISQIATVDKTRLKEHCGKLSASKTKLVLDGLALLLGTEQDG